MTILTQTISIPVSLGILTLTETEVKNLYEEHKFLLTAILHKEAIAKKLDISNDDLFGEVADEEVDDEIKKVFAANGWLPEYTDRFLGSPH